MQTHHKTNQLPPKTANQELQKGAAHNARHQHYLLATLGKMTTNSCLSVHQNQQKKRNNSGVDSNNVKSRWVKPHASIHFTSRFTTSKAIWIVDLIHMCVYTSFSTYVLIYLYKCYIMSHPHSPTMEPPVLSNVAPNLTSSSITQIHKLSQKFSPTHHVLKKIYSSQTISKKPIKWMLFGSGLVPPNQSPKLLWDPQPPKSLTHLPNKSQHTTQ